MPKWQIVAQSSSSVFTYGGCGQMASNWLATPVGHGDFTVESDKEDTHDTHTHTHTHTHGSPTRTGPCTFDAVGLLSSRRGVATPGPCPTTLCVWRSLHRTAP